MIRTIIRNLWNSPALLSFEAFATLSVLAAIVGAPFRTLQLGILAARGFLGSGKNRLSPLDAS